MDRIGFCMPTAGYMNWAVFTTLLNELNTFEKDQVKFYSDASTQSLDIKRNKLVRLAIEDGCNKILFVDDDVVVSPGSLLKLTQHSVPIVAGVVARKSYPHDLMIYKDGPDGKRYIPKLEQELFEIDSAATSMMCVDRSVFKQLPEPWFKWGGETGGMTEDIFFCWKCKTNGIRIYCDPTIIGGHLNEKIVWPGER